MAKLKLPERACLVCSRLFQPTRAWHKFCSHACREDATRNERLADYVCVYCGLLGDSIDHVPPLSVRRRLVELGLGPRYPCVEVRACRECNSALGSRPYWTVALRTQFIKRWLKRRYAKYLKIPNWSDRDLAQMVPHMQDYVLNGLAVKALTERRLQ